jgi:peptidoglycan hydrolase CwlO-like protein
MTLTLPQAMEAIAHKYSEVLELAAQKCAQIRELIGQLESTQHQLATLQHQMEQMLKRLYGHKSEKLNPVNV